MIYEFASLNQEINAELYQEPKLHFNRRDKDHDVTEDGLPPRYGRGYEDNADINQWLSESNRKWRAL